MFSNVIIITKKLSEYFGDVMLPLIFRHTIHVCVVKSYTSKIKQKCLDPPIKCTMVEEIYVTFYLQLISVLISL